MSAAAVPIGAAFLTFLLLADQPSQEPVLRGRVVSSEGVGLSSATIRIAETGEIVRTNDQGIFRWPGGRVGRWDVTVQAIGFQPARVRLVADGQRLMPNLIRLEPAPQQLDSLSVEAPATSSGLLADFDRRRRTGSGRYFSDQDIARTGALRVSSLLRMLPAGVRVQDSAGIPVAVSNRGPKLVADGGQFYVVPCVLRTAIDGEIQPWGTSLDAIDPTEIVGIEVYLGASAIPAEFAAGRRDQFCGLLVFWTRRAAQRGLD